MESPSNGGSSGRSLAPPPFPPPSFAQVGDARKMLWHDAHGNWVAGESVHLGHAAGVLGLARGSYGALLVYIGANDVRPLAPEDRRR